MRETRRLSNLDGSQEGSGKGVRESWSMKETWGSSKIHEVDKQISAGPKKGNNERVPTERDPKREGLRDEYNLYDSRKGKVRGGEQGRRARRRVRFR